jgi:hypothetical protein
MKGRLLLTSALFVFVHIPAQAQVTVDVAKITCQQILKEELASPTHDIVLWLSGYYSGKRNNMTINLQTINNDEQKVRLYCYKNPDTTVLDAIKNVLGFDKWVYARSKPDQQGWGAAHRGQRGEAAGIVTLKINYGTACAFRLLRQPSRPKPPRPVANSGSAAGSGVVVVAMTSVPDPKLQQPPISGVCHPIRMVAVGSGKPKSPPVWSKSNKSEVAVAVKAVPEKNKSQPG